jgi:carbon storage regulator
MRTGITTGIGTFYAVCFRLARGVRIYSNCRHCDLPRLLGLYSFKEERAMLVLSRKLGQRFQVGQDVRVTIVKIDRNSVRIGIEAPNDVTVYREEIVPVSEERPVNAGVA